MDQVYGPEPNGELRHADVREKELSLRRSRQNGCIFELCNTAFKNNLQSAGNLEST